MRDPGSRVSRIWAGLRRGLEQSARSGTWADALSLACFVALSGVMLVTLDDYGLTYDEEPHIAYGDRVLDYYASGFRASSRVLRSSYGVAFDVAAALLRRISPWDAFRTNHILSVFVAQVGLLGTWKLGRLLSGPSGGLLSLLFLVLTPVYYGHQFNNPKDIPFAAGYVWGLYCIARLVIVCSPRPDAPSPQEPVKVLGWRFWFGLALALGLGMSVRVGGAVLVGYLLSFLGLVTLDHRFRLPGAPVPWLRPIWARTLLAVCGAWLLLVAVWPRALASPIEGPRSALETVIKYTAYDSPTLLRGKLIPSRDVPWDYLPTYFAIQLPELTLLAFAGCCSVVLALSVAALRRRKPIPWAWLLLVLSVFLPPLVAIVRHSTLYDGLRHFLFLIPPISVLAGAGMSRLISSVRPRPALLLAGSMGLFTLDQAAALWRLHPHQHVFFNRVSGGLANAIHRYETEYYGSVYRELLTQLVDHLWTTRRDEYLSRAFVVAGCGSNLFFKENLPLNFQYAAMRSAPKADYYATYARDRCLKRYRDRELVTAVTRDGATIAAARDMKRKRKSSARSGSRRATAPSPSAAKPSSEPMSPSLQR